VANGARPNFFFGVANRVRERQRILSRRSEQVKRQALRGLLANSWEVFQLIDESFDGSGKVRHAACVA
jgi:hypothetical protein